MSDHIFRSLPDAPPPPDGNTPSGGDDISRLIPYFVFDDGEFVETLSDPRALFDHFGITAEELASILKDL